MSDDLKPCPFCGMSLTYEAPVAYFHPIGKCILSGRNFKKGVIGQWNRRADLREAEVARLRAVLDAIAKAKPQPIGDTGFETGPFALWAWAQRIARAALAQTAPEAPSRAKSPFPASP